MDHSLLDPLGSLPIFVAVMKGVAPQRRRRVAIREGAIAFAVLLAFMWAARAF